MSARSLELPDDLATFERCLTSEAMADQYLMLADDSARPHYTHYASPALRAS